MFIYIRYRESYIESGPIISSIYISNLSSKAPACEVGRISRAFLASGEATSLSSVVQASRVHESHAARDSQRLFSRWGLKLNVPIKNLKIQGSVGETLPFLRISDFFRYLLDRYPKLLMGGHPLGDESDQLCQRFWAQYKEYHPSHQIFQKYPSPEQWQTLVPLLLHGDKGRTYKKSPIFNFSFEAPFGLPAEIRALGSKQDTNRQRQRMYKQEHGSNLSWTCAKRSREQAFPEHIEEESCSNYVKPEDFIPHNARGSTLMTRFLIAAIPNKVLKGHPRVVESLLKEMQQDLSMLFHDGVLCAGRVFRCGLIGVKGDFEFHLEVGGFFRSYANIGTKNDIQCCPECEAGAPGISPMDMREVPAWASTCYQTEPWLVKPPLNYIPYDDSRPASLYKRDVFHTLKFGFMRDLCASIIVHLAQLGYFDPVPCAESRSLDARLERAYSYFKLWCIAESKRTTLRKFSRNNFHRKKATSFPFLAGKGSDSVLACCFLVFFVQLKLRSLQDQSHAVLLHAMLETLQGGIDFTAVMHSHGVFLTRACARFMMKSGYRLLRGYAYLADTCINERRRLYALRPKLHFFHHTLRDMQDQLDRGDTCVLSPGIFNCEANEDFIGRISRISRRVSPRLASLRTTQYYLVACKLQFRRAGL